MKSNTKSSITLPAEEKRLVQALKKRLKARSNVEVVRRGLHLLQRSLDRAQIKEEFREASLRVRDATLEELAELDHLSGEGFEHED